MSMLHRFLDALSKKITVDYKGFENRTEASKEYVYTFLKLIVLVDYNNKDFYIVQGNRSFF